MGETSEIDIEIDVYVNTPADGHGSSWGARTAIRQKERRATLEALGGIERPVWSQYHVSLIRVAKRKLDDDNLAGAFKSVRDQIADWLGFTDDAASPIFFSYGQLPTKGQPYARAILTPQPHATPNAQPRQRPGDVPQERKELIYAPRAKPEMMGSEPLSSIELAVRAHSQTSRIKVRLMRNMHKAQGVGLGVCYVHASVFWTGRNNTKWRSQGISIFENEIDAFVDALRATQAEMRKRGGG